MATHLPPSFQNPWLLAPTAQNPKPANQQESPPPQQGPQPLGPGAQQGTPNSWWTAQVMNYSNQFGPDPINGVQTPGLPNRPNIPAQQGTPQNLTVYQTPKPTEEEARAQEGQPNDTTKVVVGTNGKGGGSATATNTTTTPTENGGTSSNANTVAVGVQGGNTTLSQSTTNTTADGSGNSTAVQNGETFGFGNGQLTYGQNESTTSQYEDGSSHTDSSSSTTGIDTKNQALTFSDTSSSSTTTVAPNGTPQTASDTTTTNWSVGPNYFGAGMSQSATDANGSTNGYSMNGGYNATTGTLSGGGTITSDGTTYGLNGSVTQDTAALNATIKRGQFSAGAGFSVTADQVKTSDLQGGTAGELLGGNYASTSVRNQIDLSASASARGIGASGSMSSGNTLEVLTAANLLPPEWATMTPEQKESFSAQRMAAYQDGVSVEEMLSLQSGQGVRMQSYNGWSLGGSMPVGGMATLSAGGGQTSAHEVTIVRGPRDGVDANGNPTQLDRIVVNIANMQGSSGQLGAAFAGAGLTFGGQGSNTHQYQIEIDPAALEMGPDGKPKNPAAYQAVDMMLKTGLMPGAGQLSGEGMPERYAAFEEAYEQTGSLTSSIDAKQAALQGAPPGSARAQALQAELVQLYGQLDAAQQTIESNREVLNQAWEATYSPENQPNIPGVSIRSEENIDQQTNSMTANTPFGDVQVASTQTTWAEQQYLTAQNQVENEYRYDQQHYFFGNLEEQFSAQTTTGVDPTAALFGMYSDNNVLLDDNADIIRNIENRDVPDYVLDDGHWRYWMRGRLNVQMNADQFNTMTATMNDMSNPQSQAMWQDMGTRVTQFMSGDQYWLPSGADEHSEHLRGMGMDADRDGWIQETFNGYANPDAPTTRALQAMGDTPEEAQQKAAELFQGVNSPQAFAALTPDQQQLFIALIDQTSGSGENVTDQRSSFEALAAISLIEDPNVKAQTLRSFMADANEEAQSDHRDGAMEFVHFTERFKDNPAVYDTIQQAISYDWTQEQAERFAAQSEEQIATELNRACNETDFLRRHDPNEGKALDALMAANMKNGVEGMRTAIQSSGVDMADLLASFTPDSIERRLFVDLISQMPEYSALLQPNSP